MNVPVRKWYERIIPFLLVFCLLCNQLFATPDCPIVTGNFSGLANGTTVNNSSTGWYLNATNVSPSAIFWVKSNRFHAQELGGEGIWYSKVFSVTGYTDFQIATKITAEGDMNSTEYVKVFYKINGGAEILLDQRTGNFGTVDFVSPLLNGSTVQFVIRIYNYNNGGSQTSKYYIEDYRVFKTHGPCAGSSIPVSLSASNNGLLTCTSSSLTLSASSTASGVAYSWTGPGNFSSTSSNPVITLPGTYNVVGTNSSGSGSASIVISENKALPELTATGGSLGCAAGITIHASSPVANAQYAWTGPGFSASQQNPVVSAAGTYTVTVTNPANGCTSSKQVQVTAGSTAPAIFWLEDFLLANGTTSDSGPTPWTLENPAAGTFSVQNNELMASFSSANEGVWRSGIVDIAAKSNVVFSLNLRSGTAGSSDFLEDDDYVKVYYRVNEGPEILLFSDVAGLKGTTTGTAYDTVVSPALNGASLQIIVRLKNSNTTERYYLDNVIISGYDAGASPLNASVSGAATCAATAQLSASANSEVASWSWTGPDNYTSSLQNPAVSAGGQYIVTAHFTNGCSASVPVTVTENKTAPGLTANGGSLGCFASIQISAVSPLATAQFSWTGPNGFASTLSNPSVTTAGTYTVTATDPANGCTATQTVQVTGAAGGSITAAASVSDTLTCAVHSVTLSGSSNTAGVVYSWTGPAGFTASTQNTTTTEPGVYTLTVTSSSCSSTVDVNVYQKNSPPADIRINEAGTNHILTCNVNNVVVFASSSTPGATYSWTGPNNYSASSNGITAFNAGVYTVTVTDPANGCSATASYTVQENRTFPGANISPVVALLTCNTPTRLLTGSATATTVKYSWTGPGGVTAAGDTLRATTAGNYYLLVTDTVNGCTTSTTATMSENKVAPANIVISPLPANGQITCSVPGIALNAGTATAGVLYSWQGPNGFNASIANPVVTLPGNYVVTITDPANGCTASDSTVVTRDITPPAGVSAFSSDKLTCFIPAVTISGSSTTAGATFSWTGPNGFTAATANSLVSTPGTYQLKVTNPVNGCTETIPVTVAQNITVPDISVANTGPLTCSVFFAEIQGSSSTEGVDYSWTGPDGFASSSPVELVFSPGDYVLTVLDLNNGCTATDTTTVTEDYTACQGARTSAMKTGSVRTETAVAPDGKAAYFEYRAYPNPFEDKSVVEFKAQETTPVNVSIYNSTGICKKVLFNGTAQSGQLYKLQLEAAALPAGIYYCIIRIDRKIYTLKMLLLRK